MVELFEDVEQSGSDDMIQMTVPAVPPVTINSLDEYKKYRQSVIDQLKKHIDFYADQGAAFEVTCHEPQVDEETTKRLQCDDPDSFFVAQRVVVEIKFMTPR